MAAPPLPNPPRLACWLVSLFAPTPTTDPLLGDLLEDFSAIAASSGPLSARRWYWRQVLDTILQSLTDARRAAALWMFTVIVGGLWFIGYLTQISVHVLRTFGDANRLYESHPDAYLFLSKFPFTTGHVLLCFLIAIIVATISGKRAMPAVLTLAFAQMALFLIANVAVIASGHAWLDWFLTMSQWNLLSVVASVGGGVTVRIWRRGSEVPGMQSPTA